MNHKKLDIRVPKLVDIVGHKKCPLATYENKT